MTSTLDPRAEGRRLGGERRHEMAMEDLTAFAEEREFFMEYCGMTDPQICERLGMAWPSYRRRFLRHPELGPIVDPEENERQHWAAIMRASDAHQRQARRST